MPRTEAQRLAHNRRAARYRERHRAEINARWRARGKSAASLERDRQWRRENAEALAAYQRDYYERHRERKLAQVKVARQRRRAANPDAARDEARSRRLADPDAASFAPVLLADPCAYCDQMAETIDHITPRSAGGEDGPENLAGACNRCNARKSTIPLLRFLLRLPVP